MNERIECSVRGSLVSRVLTTALAVFLSAIPASAQNICDAGNQVVTTLVDLTASCTITGSLTINGGMVRANFGDAPAKLRVEGDVSITGTGVLWIDGGIFEIQQDYSQHRQMQATDEGIVVLRNTTVVLNQGLGVKSLVYSASKRSKTFVVDSALDRTNDWLLSNHFDQSSLVVIRSQFVPTEIYVKDSSTVSIGEPTSETGLWLDFAAGTAGEIALPSQADALGDWRPYSWRVGRDTPGLTGVGWQVEIAGASVGLGVESHSGSQITVIGRGAPSSGEVKIAYHVEGGTQTIAGLPVGLQNLTVGGNQLTLRNVDVGPIAWQVYAHDGATLTVNSSILNEIGAVTGAHIDVHDSIIQFGGLISLGVNAASIAVHNSQIHSQSIEALRDGIVDIHNSAVFGAAVVAHEPSSSVNFHAGALLRNQSEPCPLILDQMVSPLGIPLCNPFLAPGAAVTRAGGGNVSCDGTFNCTW